MCIQRNDSVNVDFLDGIDCICFAFSHYEPISLVLEAIGGGGDDGDDVDAANSDTGGEGGGDGGGDGDDVDAGNSDTGGAGSSDTDGDGDDVDPENQQMVILLMVIRLTKAALVIILQMNC